MKKNGRIEAEILEQLSDNEIHSRAEMLAHQKKLLRGKEEPHIDFKFNMALSTLMKINYICRKARGEYKITPEGLLTLGENRENLYKRIEKYEKITRKNSKLAYKIFQEANEIFVRENIDSIERNVAEECLCAALSRCIERVMETREIREYYVDTNYNRNEDMYKTIINGRWEIKRIICDLIVHSRGENREQDNLLAIEMKKKSNTKDRMENKERLEIMTKNTYYGEVMYEEIPRHICRYALGIFYDIDISKRKINLEFYKAGKLEWTENMSFDNGGSIKNKSRCPKI